MFFLYLLIFYLILGGIGLAISTLGFLFMGLIYYVLYAIGSYRLFTKAGLPGWWAFVPIYNEYQLFKMSCGPALFWLSVIFGFFSSPNSETGKRSFFAFLCSLVVGGIELVFTNRLARAYGRSDLFGLGLLFFQPLFVMILGLGDSEYLGPQM